MGGHIGATWQIWLNLYFLHPTHVHNRNGKSIGKAIFALLMAVPSGTLAPPGEYDWTCASFGPPESTTQMAKQLVQPFLHSWLQKVPNTLQCALLFSQKVPLPVGGSGPHLTYDCLGPAKSTTQMASGSVWPFLHSVPILNNGLPLWPQNCPFPWEDLDLHLIRGSLAPPRPQPKRHLDWFSRFCRAHYH